MSGTDTTMHAMPAFEHARDDGAAAAVRQAHAEALARRAAGQNEAVRRLLDARLASRVAAPTAGAARRPGAHRAGSGAATAPEPQAASVPASARAPAVAARPRSAMAALLEHLAREGAARDAVAVGGDAPSTIPRPALDRLDEVRRISREARSASQLRQALEHAPENAGPLNSARLVHRALSAMHDVSPGCLQPFMAYVDALARLEDLALHEAAQVTGNPATGGATRRARKPRARRG